MLHSEATRRIAGRNFGIPLHQNHCGQPAILGIGEICRSSARLVLKRRMQELDGYHHDLLATLETLGPVC